MRKHLFKVGDKVVCGQHSLRVKEVLEDGVIVNASSIAPPGVDWSSYFISYQRARRA